MPCTLGGVGLVVTKGSWSGSGSYFFPRLVSVVDIPELKTDNAAREIGASFALKKCYARSQATGE